MVQSFDPARLSFRRFAALFAALFLLSLVPLTLTGVLPLVDYPNHLARMDILARLPQAPVLQSYYALAWRPIPDLAMDLLVPPLLRMVPLLLAGKLFVALTFFLLAAGPAARSTSAISFTPATRPASSSSPRSSRSRSCSPCRSRTSIA